MLKKICFVDEDGRFGGPQQRMLLTASELKRNNIEVEIVIPKDETGIFKKKLIEEKIKFHELGITRLSLKPNFLIKYLIFSFMKLLSYFQKQNYDLIQANSTHSLKVLLLLYFRIKTAWIIEDSYFPSIVVFFLDFYQN